MTVIINKASKKIDEKYGQFQDLLYLFYKSILKLTNCRAKLSFSFNLYLILYYIKLSRLSQYAPLEDKSRRR